MVKEIKEEVLDVRFKVTGKEAVIMRRYLEKKMKDEGRKTLANTVVRCVHESIKSSIN